MRCFRKNMRVERNVAVSENSVRREVSLTSLFSKVEACFRAELISLQTRTKLPSLLGMASGNSHTIQSLQFEETKKLLRNLEE